MSDIKISIITLFSYKSELLKENYSVTITASYINQKEF